MDTINPITIEISAAELPESIVSRFSKRPSSDMRMRVTVEVAESDDDKFWALKEAIDKGLADLNAGRSSDGEAVLARLEKRFPPP